MGHRASPLADATGPASHEGLSAMPHIPYNSIYMAAMGPGRLGLNLQLCARPGASDPNDTSPHALQRRPGVPLWPRHSSHQRQLCHRQAARSCGRRRLWRHRLRCNLLRGFKGSTFRGLTPIGPHATCYLPCFILWNPRPLIILTSSLCTFEHPVATETMHQAG